MPHDISDPITVASVLVRDHLDTVILRHGQAEQERRRTGADRAVSAAVRRLASALLEHLPGETRQLRTEREK